MGIRLLRLATLLSTALVVGLTFAHVMELPQKMSYGYEEYARVQHSLYAYFAYVGGPLEVLSIVLALVLAMVIRRNRPAFAWTLTGAILLAVGLAEWGWVVQAANNTMAAWTVGHVPAGWKGVRDQWEFGHLAHFVLLSAGFVVLLWSSLRSTAEPA